MSQSVSQQLQLYESYMCHYSQYPFRDTLSKKPLSYRNEPTNLQCKSTDWFLYDTSPNQRCLHTGGTTKELLDEELKRIAREFIEVIGDPEWIVNQLKEECKLVNEQDYRNIETNIDNNIVTTTNHMLVLPYKGEKGEKLIVIKQACQKVLPENHLSRYAYSSKRLGSFLNIKDQTKLEHNNDLTYLVKCPERSCSENYLGETTRRINERVLEHAGKDKGKSHVTTILPYLTIWSPFSIVK